MKNTKLSCILSIIVLFTFLCAGIAYCDAPGVPEPGKRVPPRTAAQKKPAAKKKAVKPAKTKKSAPAKQTSASAPVSAQNPATAIAGLETAAEHIDDGRYQKALPYILRALSEWPGNADAWYWFAVWNDKTGNFANAQKYFMKTLEIDPDYPALSRVVNYPDGGPGPFKKIPLWDSRRPNAIEDIKPLKEMDVVAPGSPEYMRESAGILEIRPEAPVYLPPEP